MRTECLNHRYVYNGPMETQRLVQQIADKSQVCSQKKKVFFFILWFSFFFFFQHHTQRYGKRPYGVGLLVAGYDSTGPHIFETCPSGNFYDFYAQAIGARSQAAKTYLEKKYQTFPDASEGDLIKHVIRALRETVGKGKDDDKLTAESCAIGIVGKDSVFKILSVDEVRPYLEELDAGAQPMDVGQ